MAWWVGTPSGTKELAPRASAPGDTGSGASGWDSKRPDEAALAFDGDGLLPKGLGRQWRCRCRSLVDTVTPHTSLA